MKKLVLSLLCCLVVGLIPLYAADELTLMKTAPSDGETFLLWGSNNVSSKQRPGVASSNAISGGYIPGFMLATGTSDKLTIPASISVDSENVGYMTIETVNNTKYLKLVSGTNAGKYLKGGTSKNSLSVVEKTTDASEVDVTVNSNTGKATIKLGTTYLTYNATSASAARVSNYGNTTTGCAYLYKLKSQKEEASVEWNTTGWTHPDTDGTASSPIELKVGESFNLKANITPAGAASLIDLNAVGNGINVTKNADGDWTINATTLTDGAYVEATIAANDNYFLASDDISKETYRCYFKVVEGEVETIVPEQAVSEPAASDGTIIRTKGEIVKFSAPKAAQLSVKIGEADATLVTNPYNYTVSEDVTVKVVPVDNKGALYEDLALTVNIDAVAKVPAKVTATYAGENTSDNAVNAVAGSKVTFSSTNAAKLSVKIGDAAATEQANPYEYTVTEGETKIVVTPIDSDGALHPGNALKLTITGYEPQTVDDVLTLTTMGIKGSTYTLYEYKSTTTNAAYYAKVANNQGIQINSSSNSSGINSGIVSYSVPNGYVIEKITLEPSSESTNFSPDKITIKVSNTPGKKKGTIGGTKTDVEVNGATDGVTITNINNNVYTPSGDYKFFALTTTGAQYFYSITVTYRKPVPAAPKAVTFSQKEGYYTEGSLDVTLGVDPEAYPKCQIYYTLDATQANETKTLYDGNPIAITPTEGANTVTLNVYAVNSEGSVSDACTYVLNAEMNEGEPAEIVEDLYLYQEKEEFVDDDVEGFEGYKEAAYRFAYDKANHEYTLTIPTGLSGQFWIRDGKANHAGTFFGTDVNAATVAEEPATAPRRAAAQLDANGNKHIEAEEGVWHNLVYRQTEHAKFDTHNYSATELDENNNPKLLETKAIENPTITVKYVPGSKMNAVMKISGNNVTTGVEGIINDVNDGEAVYFNMQGLRVNEPQKGGVYVRVQNGKAVKIAK